MTIIIVEKGFVKSILGAKKRTQVRNERKRTQVYFLGMNELENEK
jgi:hypothetical protein